MADACSMDGMRITDSRPTIDDLCLAAGLGLITLGATQDLFARIGLADLTGAIPLLAGGAFICASFVLSVLKRH